MRNFAKAIAGLVVFLGAYMPFAAWAHDLAVRDVGFFAGLLHPVFGPDHLLAMLSVGIVSAQIGGRAIWTVPAVFVIMMLAGGIAGFNQVFIPYNGHMLAFSVIALGLAIAAARKMPVPIVMLFVAIFGIYHGLAHGLEMPAVARPFPYAAGFVIATACIHIAGVLISLVSERINHGTAILRYTGAVFAGIGIEMILVMHHIY